MFPSFVWCWSEPNLTTAGVGPLDLTSTLLSRHFFKNDFFVLNSLKQRNMLSAKSKTEKKPTAPAVKVMHKNRMMMDNGFITPHTIVISDIQSGS